MSQTSRDRAVRAETPGTVLPRVAANEPDPGRNERWHALVGGTRFTLLFTGVIGGLLLYGWQKRGDVYLAPDQGVGYVLGIVGATMMLLLLLYPLRKHAGWMRRFGQVRHWFRMHMVLGVVGPLCILYHCNFQPGSMNSNVALFSMILVAGSGLVGRYFYTRVHYGLYGKKADLMRLTDDAAEMMKSLNDVFEVAPALRESLLLVGEKAQRTPHALAGSFLNVICVSARSRWYGLLARFRLRRALNVVARRRRLDGVQLRELREASRFYLGSYLETTRRVAGFSFYERLFALWHILHLPLFLMLLISGVVHVYAVHLY